MKTQAVSSPGGIEAWLIEDASEPMFTLQFAFRAGSAQDPPDKEGLTNFLALTLPQGAGDLSAVDFQEAIEDLAIRLEFKPAVDTIGAVVEALTEARNEAAELVGMALSRPRFDSDAMERVRARLLSFHHGEARHPRRVADAQWQAAAFPGHPYAQEGFGNDASIRSITAEDLRSYCKRVFTKDMLKVIVVGDITADEVGEMLDRLFGDLPATSDLAPVPTAHPVTGGRLRVAEMDIPQSVVSFGMGTVAYDSPDLMPAYVLNQIIGGGLYSRLSGELRHKRGLVFDAKTWLERRRDGVVLRGRLATRNDTVSEALAVVQDEMLKVSAGDITQSEFDDAKRYLIGADPLSFRSHREIAKELLSYALDGFGPHFVEVRKSLLEDVTRDDVARVAGRMLDPENLIVSIVGTPALQPRAGK